jgi:signal transduction histidine kinase
MLFSQLELTLLALAVVVDSVLLLILLERVNRPNTATWLFAITLATWSLHATGFCHALIRESDTQSFVILDRINMMVMAISLIGIPCAMLHAAVRLNHTSYIMRPAWDWRYALCYLPLGVMIPGGPSILSCGGRVFGQCFSPFFVPYLVFLTVVNFAAAYLFLRFRRTVQIDSIRRFLRRLVVCILAITAMLAIHGFLLRGTAFESSTQTLVTLSPLSIVALFLYHALRGRLVPLVVERGLVYGASLILILVLHQVFIVPVAESMQRKSNLDIIMVEGILLLGLILAWTPLRERVMESLRYLVSQNIFKVRGAVRTLSLQLSQQESRSIGELSTWFASSVSRELDLQQTWIWYLDNQMENPCAPQLPGDDLRLLHNYLTENNLSSVDRESLPDQRIHLALQYLEITYVFRSQFRGLHGLVLLGQRSRNDRFNGEQRASLSILFDQFAATIHNRIVERERLQAERQASQQEKLAVLGLMSGSLAHEIKNPLSSIRTIAKLMREDLQGQPHAKDVDMILEEIDRLSQTTSRLLDYSKPSDDRVVGVHIESTINRLFHILQPWAKQQRVELVQQLDHNETMVRTTDAVLSEILFNLLRNAIEATRNRTGACVEIQTTTAGNQVVVVIADNGPGIDPAIRESIYRPFVTSKEYGTGLGLYIAAERVRSIGGKIECQSDASTGTQFRVLLPMLTEKKLLGGEPYL